MKISRGILWKTSTNFSFLIKERISDYVMAIKMIKSSKFFCKARLVQIKNWFHTILMHKTVQVRSLLCKLLLNVSKESKLNRLVSFSQVLSLFIANCITFILIFWSKYKVLSVFKHYFDDLNFLPLTRRRLRRNQI